MKEKLFSVTKKDFTYKWFSGRGAGGQSRNKNQNCLRLSHQESGASGTGQSSKSRIANEREAFRNLTNHPKFKLWINKEVNRHLGKKTIDEIIDEHMQIENIRVEVKDDKNRWVIGEIK